MAVFCIEAWFINIRQYKHGIVSLHVVSTARLYQQQVNR